MIHQSTYLFIATVILLICILIYVYFGHHKTQISSSKYYINKIKNNDVLKKLEGYIKDISHDNDVWYYKGMSTCVGYSNDTDETSASACPYYEVYCAGKNGIHGTYGTHIQQLLAVYDAIQNNDGVHKDCPLIYQGTD